MNVNTHGNPLFAKRYGNIMLLLLLSAAVLLTGCKEERLVINVENYVDYLNPAEDQAEPLREKFTEAHDIVESYYANYEKSGSSLSHNDIIDIKMNLLKDIFPVIKGINEILDDEQRYTFFRTELYYHFSTIRRDVLDSRAFQLDLTYKKTVFPGSNSTVQDEIPGLGNEWTVYFGQPVIPAYGRQTNKSMSRTARRSFPIGIQATLVTDPEFLGGEQDEETLDIPIILYSRLHENFTALDRWVIFLELSDGTQVEPIRSVTRDEDWFKEKDLLWSEKIPEYLAPMSVSNFGRNPRRESMQKVQQRDELFKLHSNYYQLVFPDTVNGRKLISPDNDRIKIIIMKEAGSQQKAHGQWDFQWGPGN